MSIPNLLSLLRLVLVPVFAVVFFQPAPDAHRWAVLIYLTAFLTDVAVSYTHLDVYKRQLFDLLQTRA